MMMMMMILICYPVGHTLVWQSGEPHSTLSLHGVHPTGDYIWSGGLLQVLWFSGGVVELVLSGFGSDVVVNNVDAPPLLSVLL